MSHSLEDEAAQPLRYIMYPTSPAEMEDSAQVELALGAPFTPFAMLTESDEFCMVEAGDGLMDGDQIFYLQEEEVLSCEEENSGGMPSNEKLILYSAAVEDDYTHGDETAGAIQLFEEIRDAHEDAENPAVQEQIYFSMKDGSEVARSADQDNVLVPVVAAGSGENAAEASGVDVLVEADAEDSMMSEVHPVTESPAPEEERHLQTHIGGTSWRSVITAPKIAVVKVEDSETSFTGPYTYIITLENAALKNAHGDGHESEHSGGSVTLGCDPEIGGSDSEQGEIKIQHDSTKVPVKRELEQNIPLPSSPSSSIKCNMAGILRPSLSGKSGPTFLSSKPNCSQNSDIFSGDLSQNLKILTPLEHQDLKLKFHTFGKKESSSMTRILSDSDSCENQCATCQQIFKSPKVLRQHMKVVHATRSLDFTCRLCTKAFKNKVYLKRHMVVHSDLRSFKCDQCEKTFKESSGRAAHIRNVHIAARSHLCSICGKSYVRSYLLKNHLKLHMGEKQFQCDFEDCDRRFSTKSSLAAHLRSHKGLKPHTCSICSQSFSEKNTLTDHMRVHDKSQPYSCNICDRKFSKLSNLKRHKLLHTGSRPFTCTMCNAAFVQSNNLREHMRVHSGARPFVCTVCGLSYKQYSGLHTHKKIHLMKHHEGTRDEEADETNDETEEMAELMDEDQSRNFVR